jgi:radical S-adenosyl methionine domain-containing protein 2
VSNAPTQRDRALALSNSKQIPDHQKERPMNQSHVSIASPIGQLPPAVNFHLWKPCNLNCTFCYATFDDDASLRVVRGGLTEHEARGVIKAIREAGAEKLTFVGGEPTLCPHLPALLRLARDLGFVNALVTNGARLDHVLHAAPGCVDWVGLSVDSASEATQAALGRGRGDHVARAVEHFQRLHELGIRVKLNTVVTALNWSEDMSDFVLRVQPERWKVFQVLPVEGQNSGRVEPLLITGNQFRDFVDRHRAIEANGLTIAAESNDDMTGSYAMIDPLGRFFSNVGGRHVYSLPILQVGVDCAFKGVQFDAARFAARGGRYDWGEPRVPLSISVGSRATTGRVQANQEQG